MADIRLKTGTPTEIKRTLSRVINMTANGKMDVKTANTIILGCNAVLSSIRTDEQQKKIAELEKMIEKLEMDV